MTGHRKKYTSKFPIQRHQAAQSAATRVKTSREARPCDSARDSATRPPDCWSEERCGGPPDVFVSKESSHDPSSSVPDPATVGCWSGVSVGAK